MMAKGNIYTDEFQDAYEILANDMNDCVKPEYREFDRNIMKKPLMTMIYGQRFSFSQIFEVLLENKEKYPNLYKAYELAKEVESVAAYMLGIIIKNDLKFKIRIDEEGNEIKEKKKSIEIWTDILKIHFKALVGFNEVILFCTQDDYYARLHQVTHRDGVTAHSVSRSYGDKNVEVKVWNRTKSGYLDDVYSFQGYEFDYSEGGARQSLNAVANFVHSTDAWIMREMVRTGLVHWMQHDSFGIFAHNAKEVRAKYIELLLTTGTKDFYDKQLLPFLLAEKEYEVKTNITNMIKSNKSYLNTLSTNSKGFKKLVKEVQNKSKDALG